MGEAVQLFVELLEWELQDSTGFFWALFQSSGSGLAILRQSSFCRKLKVAAVHGKVVDPRCNSTEPRLS